MSPANVTLTTGANSGIGLATALELSRRGFRSIATVRSEAKAEIVLDAASGAGLEVETALMDVNDADSCAEIVDRYRPYAIVNSAGFSVIGAIEDIGDEEARLALETMVVAPMRLARLALRYQREAGAGRIVNISSIYGVATSPLSGWYQGCKHALEAVSDALRAEVAGAGVKVILIEPGGFRTGIWSEAEGEIGRRSGSRYEGAYRRVLTGTRLAQPVMGDPSRVAKVVGSAVASNYPRARYLVGYDAQALAVVDRLTPTMVKDRVTRLILGL